MKRNKVRHYMNGFITLTAFSVFAVCVMTVLLSGANAYSRLTQRDRLAYERRTCIQYMAARVRSADSAGAVAVERFGGEDALVLPDGEYITYIYCLDGFIRELYCPKDHAANPDEGEKIIEAERMHLSLEGGTLNMALTAGGKTHNLCLSLRSTESEGTP